MSGLVTAACASPVAAQVGEPVLIHNGFVVPPGKRLLVDDMSVDCVIASEILTEQEFHKVGVERQHSPDRVPPHACRKRSIRSEGWRMSITGYVVGTGAAHGGKSFSSAQPTRQARLEVGPGSQVGATLLSVIDVNIISASSPRQAFLETTTATDLMQQRRTWRRSLQLRPSSFRIAVSPLNSCQREMRVSTYFGSNLNKPPLAAGFLARDQGRPRATDGSSTCEEPPDVGRRQASVVGRAASSRP